MASIGDLVTKLVCDASQFSQGIDQARSGNRALSGSIDQIIGKLQAQKKAMENASNTTQGNILNTASRGATEGQVNAALQLNEEVSALRAKQAAEAEAAQATRDAQQAKDSASQAGSRLLTSLRDEIATYGMSAAQIAIYRAEQVGVNPVVIAAAQAQQQKVAALRQATEAEQQAVAAQAQARQEAIIAQNAASQAGSRLLTGLRDEIATYGTLCALAEKLGFTEGKRLLEQTLNQEKATDDKLNELALSDINDDALAQAA